MLIRSLLTLLIVVLAFKCVAASTLEEWDYKKEMLPVFVEIIPKILASHDPKTGRFGTGIPIASDQQPIFALAAAWSIDDPANKWHHDPQVLKAAIRGGELLTETQDKKGQWVFRKKDNSEWGNHYNPWVYSRWIRAYSLIKDAMPRESRNTWEKGLRLGYGGIARASFRTVHNIPTHHAMGTFIAGQALGQKPWSTAAAAFMTRVVAAQDPNGFWSEHYGPVVNYNRVYVEAIGIYYSVSRDPSVLNALNRSARFHSAFIYPDGTPIETIDERNPYHGNVTFPNVGFTFSAEGRAYIRHQWELCKNRKTISDADDIACFLLYGQDGPIADIYSQNAGAKTFTTTDGKAAVTRQGAWTIALSAYCCPVYANRWIQDRQNFISVYHTNTGLIVGGGNTKLQPFWSTFTVGDPTTFKHNGSETPNFLPPPGLVHVPSNAALRGDDSIDFAYGTVPCSVTAKIQSENKVQISYSAAKSPGTPKTQAHMTLIPSHKGAWRTGSGRAGTLSKPLDLTAVQCGGWFEHNGWRVQVPAGCRVQWPLLPHNPYRKDGRASDQEGRIVLTLPFTSDITNRLVEISVLAKPAAK